MSNTTKFFRTIIFATFILSGFLFITSCGNEAEQKLISLTSLVPKDSTDQIAYIQQAIKTYNDVQNSINNENMVGRRISGELATEIISAYNEKCGPTRAVFFSFSKILASIFSSDPLVDINNGGLAVIFGSYDSPYSNEIGNAGIDQTTYNTQYLNRNTVVLKYINNVTLTNHLDANLLRDNSNTVLIDDLGKPCPNWCPPGIY